MRDLSEAMAQIIAMNIKTLRLARRQKQTEFAETLDVSQGTVARWESGATPKYDALLRLAELAGVTPQEFSNSLISTMRDGIDIGEGASRSPLVMLPVQLPSEEALTAMFDSLLEMISEEKDANAAARLLAQLLPNALAQTVFRTSAPQIDAGEARAPSGDAQLPEPTNPSRPR